MIAIRLARHGAKKTPFYHITVADSAAKRDGRFIERLGFYNPLAKGQAERLRIDLARVEHWVSVGAQPTERVRDLIKHARSVAGPADAGGQPPPTTTGDAGSADDADNANKEAVA